MEDKVAVKRAQLANAAEGGSLSNEQKFRGDIEALQNRIAGYKPSVVDISSSADKQFAADLVNLEVLVGETRSTEIRRLGGILLRAMRYLEQNHK